MFVSFGDESGNHTNEQYPFLAIAGYLASTAAWKAFNKDWARRLEHFGLEAFHMTEFLRRKTNPYNEWSDPWYEDCILQFIEVINTYNLRGFVVQVSRDDYNVLLSRRVKKKLTYDPYILVFDTVITEVLRWMYFLPEGEQVTMCFHNSSFEARARRIYKRRQQRDPQGDRLADDLLFLSDDDLPIQAADILASLARNFLRGKVSGGLPITFRVEKYLSLLGKMTPTNWRVITAEQLKK